MDIKIQNLQINFSARTLYPMIPKAELEEMLKKGYSYERIGRFYKMPMHAVIRMVRSYRLSTTHVVPTEEKIRLMQLWRERGFGDEYIQRRLGLSDDGFLKLKEEEKGSNDLLANILEKLNLKYEDVAHNFK